MFPTTLRVFFKNLDIYANWNNVIFGSYGSRPSHKIYLTQHMG